MTERPSPRRASPPPPPRSNRPRAVAELLPAVGGQAFRRFGFVQSAVVTRWPEIVGERFADVSAPESIRFPPGRKADGVLTLAVESGQAAMLQHVAPALIERVNRFFGYAAVSRILIRQGLALARRPVAPVRPVPRAAPAALGDSLRAIADPELRECLAALAGALAAENPVPSLELPVLGRVNARA